MDDSNSYWWLVRVLKTQDVGYIPAENIETPFERLARLNKHRNVDVSPAPSNNFYFVTFLLSLHTQPHKNSKKISNACGTTFLLALARTTPLPLPLVSHPQVLGRAKVLHLQLHGLCTDTRLLSGMRKRKKKRI
jgi:hypothetical protein